MKWDLKPLGLGRLLQAGMHTAHEDQLVGREAIDAPAAVAEHHGPLIEEIVRLDHGLLVELIDAISFPLCIRRASDLSVLAANAAALVSGVFEPSAKSLSERSDVLNQEARHAAQQSAAAGTHAIVEYAWPAGAGFVQNNEIHAHPIFDDSAVPALIIEYMVDVTDRYRAESLRRESEANLRLVLESSPNAVVMFGSEGIITDCNRKAPVLLGFQTKDTLIGRRVWDFIDPEIREQTRLSFARTLLEEIVGDVECTLLAANGTRFFAEVSAVAIDRGGTAASFIMIMRDVTERKRFQAMLEKGSLDLRKRIRELNCLTKISRLIDSDGRSPEDMLKEAVEVLPSGWQYPEIACARIVLERQEFKTDNYRETIWKQACGLFLHGNLIGGLEICYLEERPPADEGPFLKEEGELLNAIAEDLGKLIALKRTYLDLRRSEKKYRSLFEANRDAIFIVESQTLRIVDCNAQAELLTGRGRSELLSMRAHEIYPANLEDAVREGLSLQAADARCTAEAEIVAKNGRTIPVSTCAALVDINGRECFQIIFGDISERKETERILRAARDEAEHANTAKSQFIANVSHEIRTPMNAVIGFTDILLETELANEQREYAGIVKTSAETLLSLIDDILDFSKIEAGRLHFEDIPFEPERIAYDVCKLLCPTVAARGIELLCDVGERVPRLLHGDPFRFRQVLINLLANAAKFTASGEIELVVDVDEIEGDRFKLHVTVRDTGIGIERDKLPIIFSPFQQADGSTTRKHGGTGLGLTICRQIATLLGGDVSVESEIGKGSCFHFRAWFRKAAETPGTRPAEMPLPPRRLLVLDDNERARVLLARNLGSLGMHVAACAAGAEAIRELTAARDAGNPVDLCIVDTSLLLADGGDLITEMRHLCRAPHPSVIGTSLLIERAAHTPVVGELDGHVSKPVRKEALRELLERLTPGRADERPAEAQAQKRPAVATGGADDHRAPRILLAEDNPVNQKLARLVLAKAGLEVDVANNGRQAVDRFTADPDRYVLILMDIQMPVMDGIEATKRIRAKGFTRIPIVAMTARAMDGDQESCLEAGMNDYITKPIRKERLLEVFEKLAARKENV